jgi:O-acetyl-ADP-ribose deacetylase (regulator of RNase III)
MKPIRYSLTAQTALHLIKGNLVLWKGDAIVNAANQRMLGGGGVDGAIHRAAGPQLLEACRAVPEVRPDVRCPTGSARLTLAFGSLAVSHVIHTVGPRYRNPEHSAPLLASAYGESLSLANAEGFESVAFPAISCGVYGYPLAEAAAVALKTCVGHAWSWQDNPTATLSTLAFVLFSDVVFGAFNNAAQDVGLTVLS